MRAMARLALIGHGAKQSMSRRGNYLDNAVAESFFSHLKQEFIRRRVFSTVTQFRNELDDYIYWFNHERIREKLGGLSPVKYRAQTPLYSPDKLKLWGWNGRVIRAGVGSRRNS